MTIAALVSAPLLFQAAPAATTGRRESVTTGSAVVTGIVNPSGTATTYQLRVRHLDRLRPHDAGRGRRRRH